MSFHSSNEDSLSMSRAFMDGNAISTFSECNAALYNAPEMNIFDYLEAIKVVPYDFYIQRYTTIQGDTKWVENIIYYLTEISRLDPRDFKISAASLISIGIDPYEPTYDCMLGRFLETKLVRSDARKERRFLKRHKLQENVDYIVRSADIDEDIIEVGYSITRAALYRIISNFYGNRFLESILSRMGQILFYFDDYKQHYHKKYIRELQQTIDELNSDISLLTDEIRQKHANNHVPMIEYNDRSEFDSSDVSNRSVSSIASNVIMNDKEYHEELSTIHELIETKINRVDDRISDINVALVNITSKIEDLVGSIAMVSDEVSRQSNNSFPKDSLSDMPMFRDSESSSQSSNGSKDSYNTILNHAESIFEEFESFGTTPPRREYMTSTNF